jgi:hypothetical protein
MRNEPVEVSSLIKESVDEDPWKERAMRVRGTPRNLSRNGS